MKFYAIQFRDNAKQERIRILFGDSRKDIQAHIQYMPGHHILFPVNPCNLMREWAAQQIREWHEIPKSAPLPKSVVTQWLGGFHFSPTDHADLRRIRKFRKAKTA